MIATRRRHPQLARVEAGVLRILAAGGAPVPKVLAFDGTWLVQEDLGTRRLSRLVREADADAGAALLDAALDGLATCHEIGRQERLADRIARGHNPLRLLAVPERIGRGLGGPLPFLPDWRLIFELQRPWHGFIKWDVRLGNAIRRDDGRVAWVDWDECGRGETLRDLVKLLCDDWVPDRPEVEAVLLERHLEKFLGAQDVEQGRTFAAVYGTLLSLTRLGEILRLKRDGPWWDAEACLEHELVAVSVETARRHCRRGARWAMRSTMTEGLASWIEALADRLPET